MNSPLTEFTRQPMFPSLSQDEFAERYPDVRQEVLTHLQAGFVPRVFRATAASNPAVAMAAWGAVREILCKGKVSRLVKEMLFTVIAQTRKCRYCATAHYALACRLGVPKATMELLLARGDLIRPQSTRLAIQLALDVSQHGHVINKAYYTELLDVGIEHEDIVELVAMAGVANLMIGLADGLMVEPDAEFERIIELAV